MPAFFPEVWMRRFVCLLLFILLVAGAGLYADDLQLGFYGACGLDFGLASSDPGLDFMIDLYNTNHSGIDKPMGKIPMMIGLALDGGMLFSTAPAYYIFDVRMGYLGSVGMTSAANDGHTRDLKITLDSFTAGISGVLGFIPDRVYAGLYLGAVVSTLKGTTRLDAGTWEKPGDAPIMGGEIGVPIWIMGIEGFLPVRLYVRPYWRSLNGLTGYYYISPLLNGYTS